MSYATAVRNLTRHVARKALELVRRRPPEPVAAPGPAGESPDPAPLELRPWRPLEAGEVPAGGAWCVLCDWRGPQFQGVRHSESALCPRCGSIARDRFLYLCAYERVPYRPDLKVLETSPRLGPPYREAMARRVDYLASDFDERAHRASVKLDLERMDLPDASLDVVLTAHVLEHVPDTDAALSELYRVLRPGGYLLIQVPLGQTVTAPPPEPEFHEDNSPVFWRFGFDLTERLRKHGFRTTLLVTEDFRRRVVERDAAWPEPISPEWDAVAMVNEADPADLTAVGDQAVARRAWLEPGYMHATWECVKPGS